MNTPTMTTRQRTTDGTTMQAITQDRYGEAEDVLRLEEIARPAIGDGGSTAARARRGRGPGRLAPDDRPALPGAPRGLRDPRPQDPGAGPRSRRAGRGDRPSRHDAARRRRGVRHRRRLLRPVRQRPAGQASAQASEPHLRPGRGRPRLGTDGPAGGPRPRARASRKPGADHRRVRRRRDLRRADRQGSRRRGHRRVPHGQDGHGPVPRRGPRHRLHPRGHRGRRAPLRRNPRHRGQPSAQAPPLCPGSPRDAGHCRGRDRRTMARQAATVSSGPCSSPRSPARR